jgi:hypothetical protein
MSDNVSVSTFSHYLQLGGSVLKAGVKAASASLRAPANEAVDWTTRAEACERCHLRVVQCGKSYCGRPFLQMIDRDLALDGCGCPCHKKAKDPKEHCPLTPRHLASTQAGGTCDCKWCSLSRN